LANEFALSRLTSITAFRHDKQVPAIADNRVLTINVLNIFMYFDWYVFAPNRSRALSITDDWHSQLSIHIVANISDISVYVSMSIVNLRYDQQKKQQSCKKQAENA
jgi:hypothetical protein